MTVDEGSDGTAAKRFSFISDASATAPMPDTQFLNNWRRVRALSISSRVNIERRFQSDSKAPSENLRINTYHGRDARDTRDCFQGQVATSTSGHPFVSVSSRFKSTL